MKSCLGKKIEVVDLRCVGTGVALIAIEAASVVQLIENPRRIL